MKGLYGCVLLLGSVAMCFGQTSGDFRSFQTGNWTDVNTWERFDGSVWVNPAPATPTSADGVINVLGGHTITVSANVSIDQVTIQTSGSVTVNDAVTLTIANGPGSGTDLIISAGASLSLNGTTATLAVSNGTLSNLCGVSVSGTLNNAGNITLGNNVSRLTFGSNSIYDHRHTSSAGSIPRATSNSVVTWHETSTCQITGYTTNTNVPSGLDQAFGNFVWNTPNLNAGGTGFDLNGQLDDINGDLTIQSMGVGGDILYFSISTPYTLNVDGDILVNDGVIAFASDPAADVTLNVLGSFMVAGGAVYMSADAANVTMNIGGNFGISGGDFEFMLGTGNASLNVAGDVSFGGNSITSSGGITNLLFNGAATHSFTNTVTTAQNINYTVENGSTLNLDASSYLLGDGTFTLQAGATLGVASPNGLVIGENAGNIRVAGSRTYQANGNIIYNANVAQNLGNEWGSAGALNGIAVNLEIANTASQGVTNNIIGSTSLVGNLTLTSNSLHIGNSNTLIIQSNFTATGGTIGGLSTSNLTFSGSGTITGGLNFADGSQDLNNLTISRDATISLGTPLTIHGTLSFTEAGELQFDDQTLTINGNITQSGGGASGGLESNAGSSLIIGGTGALSALPFVNASQINNITFGRTSSGTYTLGSALTVNGTLALNAGALNHSSGLTMANGSTFSRNAGASITTNAPNSSGSYNVTYSGALTTGLELPSNPAWLNNLTVSGDAALDKTVTINGDLTLNSGTLNASSFDVTVAGPNFVANGGSFTINAAQTVTFARSGATTMSGSSIGGTQFGNLTINSGASVSAPNTNINVSGTWNNLGTFTPNSGTVTFNGAGQSIDPNGQPFNNVVFANSGIKTLAGILDANGSLTINPGVELDAADPANTVRVAGTWNNSGTFTASGNTVIFDGAAQSISETSSFYNLELAGSGTKTLASAIDVDNFLTIGSGVTFSTSTNNYAITVGGNWTNNGTFAAGNLGTVTFNNNTIIGGSSTTRFRNFVMQGNVTAPSLMEVAGNFTRTSGSFTHSGGTVTFNGSSAQSINTGGTGLVFNHISFAGSNTKTLLSDFRCVGDLTLNSATMTLDATGRIVRVGRHFNASGGGSLTSANSLFNFDGSTQNITTAGLSFNNIQFTNGTKTLLDNFDANGNVTFSGASTVLAGANTLTVGGNWNSGGSTFTTTGQTIFDGVGQTILSGGNAFADLTLAGSGTKTLQDALSVNGDLDVTSTLDVSTGNYVVSVAGDWNLADGTFTARAGEVRFNGAAQSIFPGLSEFYHVRIAGTGVKTLQAGIDVNGDLTFANSTGNALDVGVDFPVEVAGNWVNNNINNDAFSGASGTVTFDGGGTSNVSGNGVTVFNSIDVTGTTNVEIETAHSLRGTLTLVGAGSSFNAEGSGGIGVFTLLSTSDDPTSDGRIATLPVPANFTGDVTVQRYMSKESMPGLSDTRLYRFISSPVQNAAVSQLQSEIPITGTFTGASTCSGCKTSSQSMWGYDETAGALFDDGWIAFPDASNAETLGMGVGYSIFVRGDIIPSALWDVRGPIFSGDVALPLTYDPQGVAGADGFNLVGNPYPSALDWDLAYPAGSNIANAIYIYDTPNGRYAQYVDGQNINGGSKDIAMGQGFWIQATGASPSLTLTEAMKSSNSTSYFRTTPPSDLLRVALTQGSKSDEIIVRFKDAATDLFDAAYDGRKLRNEIFNLASILPDSSKLSINTLASMECGREVRLDVSDVATGSYEFQLSGSESFASNVSIILEDRYIGQNIDARSTAAYAFSVDANDPESFGSERFRLIFDFNGTIEPPQVFADDVCEGSEALIEIANTSQDVVYSVYQDGQLIADVGAGNGSGLSQVISADKLTSRDNIFEIRAQNAYCNQIMLHQEFTIVKEIFPELNAKGSSNCLSGSLVLTASGAEEGDYRWYESLEDDAPIAGATGSLFSTPELNKTKTYYVAAVNSLGCEGSRVEVLAEIVSYEPVTLTETTNGQLVSSYTEGNLWYKDGELIPGASGSTLVPTESGLYSVEVKVGECVTSGERMFLVTGNEEGFSNGDLQIYPNPVATELFFQTREEQREPPMIFDQTGKVLGEIKLSGSDGEWSGTFDFSEKTRGLYILRIMENGLPKYKRIIKE